MAVDVTVEHKNVMVGGREYTMTTTRYVGLCEYQGMDGEPILADEATCVDFVDVKTGKSQGPGWSYTIHKDVTPDEWAEARRRIIQIATQAMIDQGIW